MPQKRIDKPLPPLTRALLERAARWCAKRHGRQAELAEALGERRQTVNNWMALRQAPTSEQTLKLLQFLQHRRTD